MSKLRVEPLGPALHEAWDSFVEAHPSAGIYHTRAWQRVTEQGFGHRTRSLCAVDEKGVVHGILPLFEVSGLFGHRLVSVPMRDRGGVAAASDEAARALVVSAQDLTRELGARYLELKGLEPVPERWRTASESGEPERDRSGSWHENRGWVTTRVDLTPGHDAVWSALNRKSLRWSINKARKNGVTVAEDASLEGMRCFHQLFVATRCRMGIPPFGWRLFEAIHEHVISSGRGELLLAHHEGQPVHGLLSLYSKDTFSPAYAAPQREPTKLYANELIFWTSIERALERGMATYDFGADSERQESLLFFKARWNGVQHPMSWNHYLPGGGAPPDFDSSGPRYDLVRAVWRRLPRVIAQPLGALVTRQLS